MIAARKPRRRKCSSARRMACSKSRCSKSFMLTLPLGLPGARIRQRGEQAEVEPRRGIQRIPQGRERLWTRLQLLPECAEQGPNTRRFSPRHIDQMRISVGFGEQLERCANRIRL